MGQQLLLLCFADEVRDEEQARDARLFCGAGDTLLGQVELLLQQVLCAVRAGRTEREAGLEAGQA